MTFECPECSKEVFKTVFPHEIECPACGKPFEVCLDDCTTCEHDPELCGKVPPLAPR